MTFRVVLHYVRRDNNIIITSLCHVTLLNSDSSMELDLQVVEICRDSLFLLRAI